MKNKMLICSLMIFLASIKLWGQSVAQNDPLSKTPNFVTLPLKATDTLFLQDILILGQLMSLDTVEKEMLRPSVLSAMINEDRDVIAPVTFAQLTMVINRFRKSIGYLEFRKSIILYKAMEGIKVNPKNWDHDKVLFERLGFTEADLEDFELFISMRKHRKMTYKEAYLAYMKEIDELK